MEGRVVSRLSFFLVAAALYCLAGAGYVSIGCQDDGCGIPCYLKPPGDECHYTRQDPCNAGDASDLEWQISYMNESLVRLTEKLIQKNIIPAGTSCPSLELIDHGGVIYTDLILSIGVVANYVCFNDFSLHGHGSYQCSADNQWVRTDDQSPWRDSEKPTCENSVVVCVALVPISSGHISYHTVDTTVVQPGDVAEYSCDTLYKLDGNDIRICLSNGTWSGHEPTCVAPPTQASTDDERKEETNNHGILAAKVLIPVVVLTTFAILIIVGVICYMKKRKIVRDNYTVIAENVDLSGRRKAATLEDDSEEKGSLLQPTTLTPENK